MLVCYLCGGLPLQSVAIFLWYSSRKTQEDDNNSNAQLDARFQKT